MKMKLLFLFILFSSISFGQTLENTYTSEGNENGPKNFVILIEKKIFYLTISETNSEILVYDSEHKLYKTVKIILPSGHKLTKVYLATDKLFNSDEKIEFLVGSLNSDYEDKMLLYNEDGGNSLYDFGERFEIKIFQDNDQNYKMLTFSNNDTNNQTYDIYSLSGTLTVSQERFLNKQKIIGFPNPSSKTINITNPLKNNENEKIQVYDINGRKVLEKKIVGNGKNIELDISELSKGIYNYRIHEFGNKFVKE